MTVTNDEVLQEKPVREYALPGFTPRPEDMTCRGCHSDAPCLVTCSQCPMYLCAMEPGANCGLCSDYPCDTVEELVPNRVSHQLRLEEVNRTATKENTMD